MAQGSALQREQEHVLEDEEGKDLEWATLAPMSQPTRKANDDEVAGEPVQAHGDQTPSESGSHLRRVRDM